jgi:hypothetical protein
VTEIRVFSDDTEPGRTFDLLVASLGYETRCSFAARKYFALCKRGIAVAFQERQVGSYAINRSFYTEHRFAVHEFGGGGDFISVFAASVQREVEDAGAQPRILVDISCMSRPMIASVVVALGRVLAENGIEITFVYCPAKFTRPELLYNPVTVSEPVIPELAGWSIQPERSVAAILGLGFEHDQALGALEYLEPATAWAFVPFGEDPRFDAEVAKANADLLEPLPRERIVRYNVHDPYRCFVELESLTFGVMADTRPIIVPFGPKMFALISVLIGIIHSPDVTVWRVSGDQSGSPADREASGTIVPLRTLFLTHR